MQTPLLFVMVTALLLAQEGQGASLGKAPFRRKRQTDHRITSDKSRDQVEQARLVWLHALLEALSTPEDALLAESLLPDISGETSSSLVGSDDTEHRRQKKDARHFRLSRHLGYRPSQSKRMLSEYRLKSHEQELRRQVLLAALLGIVDETLFHPEGAGHVGSDPEGAGHVGSDRAAEPMSFNDYFAQTAFDGDMLQ